MKYTDNALNILALKTYKGIGNAWIVKNILGNESVSNIVDLLNQKSKQAHTVTEDEFEQVKNDISYKISSLKNSCDGVIALGDIDFPKYRGTVKDSEQPIFIFYKGNVNLLHPKNKNIAVIGLLNPTEEIEKREKNLVSKIVKDNITIVSGLAFGCDSIAHKEAISGGNTIAILPSPLNNILPAKNKFLADEILKNNGLLISEYYEEHKSAMELNSRYKERDRLQALYSDAIILIASYAKNSAEIWNITNQKLDSGARLAMEFANNYQIPRAVMYNSDTDSINPMFDLNRELLRDNSVCILTPRTLFDLLQNINMPTSSTYKDDLF